jgi:microcystin-dependent protein
MSEPFLSELRIMAFDFAPKGWALCNGQFLPINQNQALFSLLGTTYGGNGQTTFALPDLRGKTPIHFDDSNHTLGETGGQQAHTITISELPAHIHLLNASNDVGNTNDPAGIMLANSAPNTVYGPLQGLVSLSAGTVTNVGGSQAHQNMQPYLVLSFCIALQGIFPSPN